MKKLAVMIFCVVCLTGMSVRAAGYSNITQYTFDVIEEPEFTNITEWTAKKYGGVDSIDIPEEKPRITISREDDSEAYTPPAVWTLNSYEEIFLKRTVLAECGYEQPDEGVRMVVDVILNRVKSREYPNDILGVITQQGQFATYANGSIARQTTISEQVNRIVEEEIQSGSSYPWLLYFTAGYYNPSCTPWRKVGDHYFGL